MLWLELRLAYTASTACVSVCKAVNPWDASSMVSFQNLQPSSSQRSCDFAQQELQSLQKSNGRQPAQTCGHTSYQSYSTWMNLKRESVDLQDSSEAVERSSLPSNVHFCSVVFLIWNAFSVFPKMSLDSHTIRVLFVNSSKMNSSIWFTEQYSTRFDSTCLMFWGAIGTQQTKNNQFSKFWELQVWMKQVTQCCFEHRKAQTL